MKLSPVDDLRGLKETYAKDIYKRHPQKTRDPMRGPFGSLICAISARNTAKALPPSLFAER
jgi:hypothetical protein